MTPQEYNDIKFLVTRKEWKTYLGFLNTEIAKINELMETEKDKDGVWDLKNKISGVKFTVTVAEQAIDEFESGKIGARGGG